MPRNDYAFPVGKGRKDFVFRIVYFKETGKMYSEEKYTFNCRSLNGGSPLMYELIDHIRDIRDAGAPLPGLTGSWKGPILVDHPNGFPHLIMPKKGT